MRLGEECPYITPCGFCSRQGKPCEKGTRKRVDLPPADITPAVEAFKKLDEALKGEKAKLPLFGNSDT